MTSAQVRTEATARALSLFYDRRLERWVLAAGVYQKHTGTLRSCLDWMLR